jgi:two-component system LytT family sensor kinase
LSLTLVEMYVNEVNLYFAITTEFIRIAFYAVLVYVNVYVLIPRLLNDRKLLVYGVALLVLVFLVTPLMVQTFAWRFRDHPELQDQVIRHQVGYYLLNFLLTASFSLIKIVTDWLRSKRESRRVHLETMKSELRFLKSQINPHFLFNTLNSLYALTIKKSDQAPEVVLRLADMMRYMLYECNEKWVPLDREVAYIQNYLELEKVRHGARVDIDFDTEGVTTDHRVAPLLFIPFLENAFKHGLASSLEAGKVDVKLTVQNRELTFIITNSKPPALPRPEARQYGGIGLTNVRKRLQLLYPHMHHLHIENNPNEYHVRMTVKLNSELQNQTA